MRPLTEALGYLDISSGTSEDFNKLIRSIGSDITNVFEAANTNEEAQKLSMNILTQENMFLYKKIKELETQLDSIEKMVANRSNPIKYNYIYKTFYTTDDITPLGQPVVEQDTSYGIITLPSASGNKLELLKYPREFIRKNIDIRVQVGGKTITPIEDPTLLNIIDGDEATFWVCTDPVTETDDTVDSMEFTLTINMPLRILPNLFINAIGIKPHPIYSMTLESIMYNNMSDGVQTLIPGFPKNGDTPLPIEGIDNRKFMFPTVITNSITFNFKQPYYLDSNGKRKFVIGIRNIDLENINVSVEEASFVTKFTIPGGVRSFSQVFEPTVIPLSEGDNLDGAIKHELFYDEEMTMKFYFNSSQIAADYDTVYIKTTLTRLGDRIPAIRGIELPYLSK